jgi:vacuolar-type H+-ATPase subunit H
MTEEPERVRPHIEASRRVASIMRAAEDAATDLRDEAERRSDARIAEASRAGENRVRAAEEEAAEILAEAQAAAAALREEAESQSIQTRAEAQLEADRILGEANSEAEEVQRIAEVFATSTRESAEESARKQIGRARDLAGAVLADGTEMHDNLRQLADSLVRNAEVLLHDVTVAHRVMSAKLDEAGVDLGEAAPSGEAAARPRAPEFGDVPEFIPRAPRGR